MAIWHMVLYPPARLAYSSEGGVGTLPPRPALRVFLLWGSGAS
jgi:hypothetical protein